MNEWQQRFDTDEYVYGVEANEFVVQQHQLFKGSKKIAAFADGEGRNAVFLSTKGFMLTNFDYAQNGLDKARSLASKNHVHVAARLVDLTTEETPKEEFDGAIMIFGHFLKEHQKIVFDKVMDSVKVGSYVMMELYSEEQLNYQSGGPKNIEYLYNVDTVRSWCEEYTIETFNSGEVERHEGTGHTGQSHVIQFVIRK